MIDIGAVLVTYNRLDKLKKALQCYEYQMHAPSYIVVVNNASTDGTGEFLNQWEQQKGVCPRYVISLAENTGGSGGFCAGLEDAVQREASWIWVSDDDAFPHEDALEKAVEFLEGYKEPDSLSAICGMIINNNEIDLGHRRCAYQRRLSMIEEPIPEEAYKKESVEINEFSYVGTVLSREKLKQAGLTRGDYFIWRDDTEHSLRLSKVGKILCVPAIRVNHDVMPENVVLSWKNYYGIRNRLDMIRCHFSRACFLYSSFRLWLRSVKASVIDNDRMFGHIMRVAIKDAWNGKFGIHPVYRPGWKPEQ